MFITKVCAACLIEQDAALRFTRGSQVCHNCDCLSSIELVRTVHAALLARPTEPAMSAMARRITKLQAKHAQRVLSGKRCGSCWHTKPVKAFDSSSMRGDGLQPECRSCQSTRSKLKRAGQAHLWHTVQAALRAMSNSRQSAESPTPAQPTDTNT